MVLQKRYQVWQDDSSQYDKLALTSSPKGEIVGIMRWVFSLMETHKDDRL